MLKMAVVFMWMKQIKIITGILFLVICVAVYMCIAKYIMDVIKNR